MTLFAENNGVRASEKNILLDPNQKLTHVIAGRTLAKVQQDGTMLTLEFSDGSTVQIRLEAATSSVMVRDKSGKMEYSD